IVTEYRPGRAYQSAGVAPVSTLVKPETVSDPAAPAGSAAPSALRIVAAPGAAFAAWNSAAGCATAMVPGGVKEVDFVLVLPSLSVLVTASVCSPPGSDATANVCPVCTVWPSSLSVVEATPAGSLALTSSVKLWLEVKRWPSVGALIAIAGPSLSTVNATVLV